MSIPDWSSLSELDALLFHKFAEEQWYNQVKILYNEVVLDDQADTEQIKSKFLQQCELQSSLKLMFMSWLGSFEARGNGPITYQEVLQFIHHLSWCEQKHVARMEAQEH